MSRGITVGRSTRKPSPALRCLVEPLEGRQLLSANPAFDPTFGSGGIVAGSFRATQDALANAVQSDGKIVVVGDTAASGAKKSAFIARFNANGTIDKTFGTNGASFLTYGAGGDTIFTSVQIQANGSIVVAGVENTTSSNYSALVARYTTKGVLDTTFGNHTGKELINFGGLSAATAVLIQSTGKIDVIGGALSLSTFSGGVAVAQLTTTGAMDTTFGASHNGMLVTNPGTFQIEFGTCGVINSDGRIFVGGASLAVGFSGFSGAKAEVLAVKPNGTLDTTFGAGGRATVAFGQKFEFFTGIGIDPITKNIIVGGTSANGVMSFGTPLPVSSSSTSAAVVKPAIIIPTPTLTAPAATVANFAIARLSTKNGALDKTFDANKGTLTISFGSGTLAGSASLSILSNGQVIMVGGAEKNHGNSEIAVSRVANNGKLDTAFGTGGIYINQMTGFSVGFFGVTTFSHTNSKKVIDAYFGFFVGHKKLNGGTGFYLIVKLTFTSPN